MSEVEVPIAGVRVLVVDDEPQILRALKVLLGGYRCEVTVAATMEEALDSAALRPPQAAIVDLLLPDGDGIALTRQLRAWSQMPILVLSAVGDEEEKVRALQAGADDYITKPFGPRELVARLQAALRRVGQDESQPVVSVAGLEVDFAARRVSCDGRRVHLTPIEFELLRVLVKNRGRLLTHRAILCEVWGPQYGEDTQLLRTHMARLRAKLDPKDRLRFISTDAGVGYRFGR